MCEFLEFYYPADDGLKGDPYYVCNASDPGADPVRCKNCECTRSV